MTRQVKKDYLYYDVFCMETRLVYLLSQAINYFVLKLDGVSQLFALTETLY